MSVTRGREAAFFFSNYRIRVLRFLYGTLLSAYFTEPCISTNGHRTSKYWTEKV